MPGTYNPIRLSNWLLGVAMLVFITLVVGGITRLTESGLSITVWNPVTGTLPPLSEAQWVSEFEKYKLIPEYQLINKGMSLAAFKVIYFWEWAHRVLGRLVGLALALPWVWFMLRKRLPQGYGLRIFALTALVGLQGALGWWMVASGLSERTDVSHFRLAAHLLTALFLLGGLVWTALDLRALVSTSDVRPARMTGFGMVVLFILLIQLLFGAYVAGLDAGKVSNSWPLMNDHLVPQGIDWSKGALAALTNDPFLIHFIHRWWAWVAVAALFILARRVKATGAKNISVAIHASFGIQILVGIATVMTGVALWLGVLHQAIGAIVVATTIWGIHRLGQSNGNAALH